MKKNLKKQVSTVSPSKISKKIVITSTFVVSLLLVVIYVNKPTLRQSVQGVAIMKGIFSESTLSLPAVPGATAYNIYYGSSSDAKFTHAVRQIPANTPKYTIQYLKKGPTYHYQISAMGIDSHGNKKEIWFSQITPMTNMQGM